MPEFVCAIAAFMVIASVVWFFMNSRGTLSKISVSFFALLAVVISILGSYCNPYWNSISYLTNADYDSKPYHHRLSTAEAMEDLEYAMKYLRKTHPALYHGVPENIGRQYEDVKTRIRLISGISVNELSREIESVFSILKDGHTAVRGIYENRILKYYRQWTANGYEITAVNGIPIDDLIEQKKGYYSYDAESWLYELLSDDIVTEAGIDYLGFNLENGIEYTLTAEDGRVRTEICYPDDFLPLDEYRKYNNIADAGKTEKSFVSYEIDSEKDLAMLHLDSCTYNSEYINCVRAMFQEVKEKQIHHIAVDLRYNGGGSSLVANEFIRYLDVENYRTTSYGWRLGFIYLKMGSQVSGNERYEDLLFGGNLYVLTSARTYSSAMLFAQYVKDNALGTIIGEAPGNDPNGYGEITSFKLPNSELYMQISSKRFYRADQETTDELVYPDVECGSETAMEELYRLLDVDDRGTELLSP